MPAPVPAAHEAFQGRPEAAPAAMSAHAVPVMGMGMAVMVAVMTKSMTHNDFLLYFHH
jgi:hypothetical protein